MTWAQRDLGWTWDNSGLTWAWVPGRHDLGTWDLGWRPCRSGTVSRGVCAIRAWALKWLAGPDNQQSTAPSTPLAQPLHHRPASAAICNARSDRVSQRLHDHGLGARVASWTSQSAIHTTQLTTRATTTPPTHVGSDPQRPLGNRVSQRLHNHGLGARVGNSISDTMAAFIRLSSIPS